MRKISKSWK